MHYTSPLGKVRYSDFVSSSDNDQRTSVTTAGVIERHGRPESRIFHSVRGVSIERMEHVTGIALQERIGRPYRSRRSFPIPVLRVVPV